VIVPAHNEEASIVGLIASLRGQTHREMTVILCLDRCTDGTRGAAERAVGGDVRFEILEVERCPEGWAGKVHAAHAGSQHARARAADVLLFMDADTVLEPECIGATAALMRARGLELLSLLSTLPTRHWFELVAQPVAAMELVRQYPVGRANRATRRRAFANGQFMMFDRAAYDAVGGHAAVREELLEDLALARAMERRPAGVFVAAGLMSCRMYESYAAFCAGWERIYIEAAHRKVKRLRQGAAANVLGGAVLPVLTAASLAVSALLIGTGVEGTRLGTIGVALAAAGLALWLVVLVVSYRMSRVPVWAIPLSIPGAAIVGGILLRASRTLRARRPIRWGGREYVREPR
jgi:hypothetical protein